MTADAVAQLLLTCLHREEGVIAEHGLPALAPPEWDALVDLAAAQRVRPLLHRRLRSLTAACAVPDRVLQRLDQVVRQIAFINLNHLGEVRGLAHALADARIPLMVLKGVRLATGVYESATLREMSDVDVLVHRQHLEPVVSAALARGYRPLHGHAMAIDVTSGHHLTRLVKPPTSALEIHWNVTPAEGPYPIDPAGIWTRAVPVTIGGAGALGLCLEDLLLHLCYHAAYQHQFRFGMRPFCDLATLLAREGVQLDWPALVARARAWHWDRGVYLMLRLARELVGAHVPDDALAELRPAVFDTAVALAARAHVLTESSAGLIRPGLARLAGEETLAARLRHVRMRVLPPRSEVGRLYGRRAASLALPWLYARHALSLVRQHARPVARLQLRREAVLREDARRASLLREWLG
jgi:Uncharacterised nucleotidyltransferase